MTTMTITDLELSQVYPNPNNVREALGDEQGLDELAASIRKVGIMQPLVVASHPARPGDFVVIAGHRRLAAAKRAGLLTIPCVVTDRFDGDAEQIAAMLTENIHRENITAVDEARAIQQMLDLPGFDVERVAQTISKSASTVRRRAQLLGAGEQVLAAVKEKKIDLFQAEEIAKYSDEPDLAKDMTEAAESGDDWRWKQATSRAAGTLEWRQSVDKLREHLTGLGYELINAEQTKLPEYRYLQPFYFDELPTKPQEVLELSNYIIPQKALDEYGKDCLRAYLSHGSQRVQWYAFIEKQEEEAAEPELTAEEIAEQEAREKVELALRVEHPKFKEHLEELVHKPAKLKGTAHAALIAAICDRNYTLRSVLEICGIDHDPEDKDLREKGRAKLAEKTIDQLAYALFLYEVINFNSSGTSNLYRLNEHDPAQNGNWAARKFELLESVYGIEPGEAIKQARAFWEPALPGTEAEAVSDEVNF
ncbi:ParB/RepB/Spo0J family partition protein [Rothia sp. P4278]|uniref:ParB/RepB/Spo0J family partition protein n=1 Tax=Rothia sp. P4278 TaxID=3402658 RepID=UPI003AE35164